MVHECEEQQQEEKAEKWLSDGEDDELGRIQFQPPVTRLMTNNLVYHGNAHGAQNRKKPTETNGTFHTTIGRR